MATRRIVVIPMLVTHHKTPIPPMVTAKHPPSQEEDPIWV